MDGQNSQGKITEAKFTFKTKDDEDKEDEIDDSAKQSGYFKPTITGVLDFGDDDQKYDKEYPASNFQLKRGETDLRITKIKY